MIYLFRSSDFSSTFDDNKASRFKTRLVQRTTFPSDANVTLLHIRVPSVKEDVLAYVYCSCADVVQVGARGGRLLQIVALEKSETAASYVITTPISSRLTCVPLQEIKFSIKTEQHKDIQFGEGDTTLLLQIQ